MKLVFPGGELPQVILQPGINSVGSSPDATVVIDRPGVRPRHCQLHVGATGVMLDVPADARVTVNGKLVNGLISLRDGDLVAFDRFEARLAAMEDLAQRTGGQKAVASANDELFATAVRQALPRFTLRGVSGKAFGRHFAISGAVTVGRAPDSSLLLDEAGISRAHARLLPGEEGVQVEDLGSTNGTFINGKRVMHGVAKAGDEIGFDALRFRVLSTSTTAAEGYRDEGSGRRRIDPRLAWGTAGGVALLAAALMLAS